MFINVICGDVDELYHVQFHHCDSDELVICTRAV